MAIEDKVEQFLEPLLVEMGCELVDIEFRQESGGWVLRVYIDKEDGVGLEECASVSRQLGHYIEVEDLVEQSYNLEVSSPGLERPLKREKDFIRFAGRKARVKMVEKIDNQRVFIGTLQGIADDDVLLEVDGEVVNLPVAGIKKARLVFEG